jgi:hypothetical protein
MLHGTAVESPRTGPVPVMRDALRKAVEARLRETGEAPDTREAPDAASAESAC